MKYAIDKLTGNRVRVLNRADTGTDRCVVIQHPNGHIQIQFKTMLKMVRG